MKFVLLAIFLRTVLSSPVPVPEAAPEALRTQGLSLADALANGASSVQAFAGLVNVL